MRSTRSSLSNLAAQRLASVVLLAAVLGACSGEGEEGPARQATAEASGEVTIDSGAVPMRISNQFLHPERVAGWRSAQRVVSRYGADPAMASLQAGRASEADVGRAVEYLRGREEARAAIEASGMTVEEYVQTSAAMTRAEREGSAPRDSAVAMPAPQAVPPARIADEAAAPPVVVRSPARRPSTVPAAPPAAARDSALRSGAPDSVLVARPAPPPASPPTPPDTQP